MQERFRKLWIPAKDRFIPVEHIPYLGTGKLDLAKVRAIAKEKAPLRNPSS